MGDAICGRVSHKFSEFLSDLGGGVILGSTEAAVSALEIIKAASYECGSEFKDFLLRGIPSIVASRPSSQVLGNVLRMYVERFLATASEGGLRSAVEETPVMIDSLIRDLEGVREAVAEIGSRRIEDEDIILTHSYSSTVIKTFEKALARGVRFRVYTTESRPTGEGKVMANKVSSLGVETTLIVDSAVRYVMKHVRKVFVGADAIAINGAVVNKIGTSVVALAAKEARARLFVLAGLYKFSFETVFGELVEQVFLKNLESVVPKERFSELAGKVLVRAPVFDVTPPEYIDAIITEKGVLAPQAIPILVMELYGWPPRIKSLESLLEGVKRL